MSPHTAIEIPDEMIDDIQFEIHEAPYDAIVAQLRRAVIIFCEKSHYWKEEVLPIVVVADTASYDLAAIGSREIVSVLSVESDDAILERNQSGDIYYRFWQDSPFSLGLTPVDELVGKTLTIVAAVKPVLFNSAFLVSASLISDYRDALIAGAKAMIYKVPRKPWTDLQQAQINSSVFEQAASEALLMQARGYSRTPDSASSASYKNRPFF